MMKLSGNHHMVTLEQQNNWAGLVGVLPDVTVDTPPADWIKGYLEGTSQMERKKTGRLPKKDVKIEQAAPQAPQPALQPVLPQVQPIIIQQPAPAPAPQPQYAPPRVYRHEYPRGRPRFQQQRRLPPQPASSPIRRPTADLLPEFLEYMLDGKAGNDTEEQRIKDAFEVIAQQGFQLEDLKADAAVTILNQHGVPGGTALNIQRSVSGFSRTWKARQEAAQGLQNMAQQAQQVPEYFECPRPVPRGHATYISNYMPDYSEGDEEFYGPGGAGHGEYYRGNW
jgi:hypothetical protein